MFKITFHAGVGEYDARMTRDQALSWLKSRGLAGMTSPSSGHHTPLDDLDEDRLAQAVSAATMDLVRELQATGAPLNIRNESDDDEAAAWVTVSATSIGAVKVRVVDDDSSGDEDDDEDLTPPFYDPGERMH